MNRFLVVSIDGLFDLCSIYILLVLDTFISFGWISSIVRIKNAQNVCDRVFVFDVYEHVFV